MTSCRFSKRRDPFLTIFSKPFPPLGSGFSKPFPPRLTARYVSCAGQRPSPGGIDVSRGHDDRTQGSAPTLGQGTAEETGGRPGRVGSEDGAAVSEGGNGGRPARGR